MSWMSLFSLLVNGFLVFSQACEKAVWSVGSAEGATTGLDNREIPRN